MCSYRDLRNCDTNMWLSHSTYVREPVFDTASSCVGFLCMGMDLSWSRFAFSFYFVPQVYSSCVEGY
jgi:hypothetical protein